MGYFDVTSQRRTENVDTALLLPTAEVLPELHPNGRAGLADQLDGLIARQKRRKHPHEALMDTLRQDAETIRSGALFSSADRYAALIYPDFTCAMDYISPETMVIFSDRMAVERTLDSRLDELSQGLDGMLQNGTLAGELCDFYKTFDDLCNICTGKCVIYMDNFLSAAFPESLPPKELLSLAVKQLPSYGGSLDTGSQRSGALPQQRLPGSGALRCPASCPAAAGIHGGTGPYRPNELSADRPSPPR